MARHKPAWRRVLTARYLRWWLASRAVHAWPRLGRWLGFFPRTVDMVAAADHVLADARQTISATSLSADRAFLDRCLAHDSTAPGLDLAAGVSTGRRTVVYRDAWIDMAAGAVLLPDRARTVLFRGQANWNTGSIAWRRARVHVAGRVFAPLDTVQYFHLLIENGVRLLDLLGGGLLGDAPLTVVKPPDRTAVEHALFQGIAARHPQVALRHVPPPALVTADEVVCHFPRDEHWEWPPLDRPQADALAAAFEAVYGPLPIDRPPRLFLSRGDAKLRALENEDRLAAHLSALGFDRFVAGDANHPEQIARFRAAERVVAVHGAGLTNLIFCRPGTRVVEIFPQNLVKSPYWWLSHCLGLDYRPVIGGPGDYDQRFRLSDAEMVDVLASATEP